MVQAPDLPESTSNDSRGVFARTRRFEVDAGSVDLTLNRASPRTSVHCCFMCANLFPSLCHVSVSFNGSSLLLQRVMSRDFPASAPVALQGQSIPPLACSGKMIELISSVCPPRVQPSHPSYPFIVSISLTTVHLLHNFSSAPCSPLHDIPSAKASRQRKHSLGHAKLCAKPDLSPHANVRFHCPLRNLLQQPLL